MCRLLGWAGRTPTTLHDLLGADNLRDFTGLSVKHGDGWGVARATETGVKVHKRADAARTSRSFRSWADGHASDLGMAHLRWATMGLSVGIENTHPFTDGSVAFAHNGSVSPPASLDRLVPSSVARLRRGTTDSERYFLAVAGRIADGESPRDALLATVDEIAATTTFTSLNCLLMTAEELLAVCRYDPAGPLEDEDPEYYTLRYRVGADSVVVSSSGWGDGRGECWQQLANGDLLVVARRSLETTVVAPAALAR